MASLIWKPVLASAALLVCTGQLHAAQDQAESRSGFYTVIGPDGHMMVVHRGANQAEPEKASPDKARKWSLFADKKSMITVPKGKVAQAQPNEPSPNEVEPVKSGLAQTALDKSNQDNESTVSQSLSQSASAPSKTVLTAPTSVSPQAQPETQLASTSTTEEHRQPITTIDGEQYVDSEYLEQREFNLTGQKRFYSLPDQLGGTQVIQREKGINLGVFRKPRVEQSTQPIVLSENYQRLAQDQVIELTGVQCFSARQLKSAKVLRKDEPLNVWPRPGFEPKFDFVLAHLPEQINDIQLTSYADRMNSPEFYWPLMVFLDREGCILEGANGFYQQTILPTPTTHQALQGYLHVPANTSYILLTPLEAAADLAHFQLTNKGQVRLTPVR